MIFSHRHIAGFCLGGVRLGLLSVLCLGGAQALAAEEPSAEVSPETPAILATVGDESISVTAYLRGFRNLIRTRYYHTEVPEEDILALRHEAAQELVDRKLIAQQARRRGLSPEQEAIETALASIDEENAHLPEWEEARDELLALIRSEREEKDLNQQLETLVKEAVSISGKDVQAFYADNADKFTTPERVRVSLILIGVLPYSPVFVWESAREEAAEVLQRLRQGADFAELARSHSTDPSAAAGGDMGFQHRGMLAEKAEAVLDELKEGAVSEVLDSLEGPMIIRLDERIDARLNDLETVRERAAALTLREAKEQAWEDFIEGLRKETPVSLNEALLGGGQAAQPGK